MRRLKNRRPRRCTSRPEEVRQRQWRRPSPGGGRRALLSIRRRDRGKISLRYSRAGTRWNAGPIAGIESLDRLQWLFHFVEHPQRLFEMGVEVRAHEIQDLNDDGIANGIEDLVAGLAGGDELLRA